MGKYMIAADPVLGSVCLFLRRGMDVYNKHFSKKDKKVTNISHDQFYTDNVIVDAFSRYVATIVKRYANEPSLFGTPLSII
jgi:endo-1,4-beta-mannosidase